MTTRETPQRVFVPPIGFRPAGTRTLRERAETTTDGTRLLVLAVAASPQRTEVVVEWERTGDPATCPPGSQVLAYTVHAPLDKGVTASLVSGADRLDALTMAARGYHASMQAIGAMHTITFPPLPPEGGAELQVTENAQTWRVPLSLEPSRVGAMALAARAESEGIVIRATALARHEGEMIVELEVESARQIRQVGAPLHTGPGFSVDSDRLRRGRRAEMRRVLGDRARPMTLEDERGARHEEVRRLFTLEPQQAAPGQPFVSRFAVVFESPSGDAKRATLLIPFVDIHDPVGSVAADLRKVPLDLAVGGHHFRVVSAWPHSNDHQRVIVEARPSPRPPRFVHPARMAGAEPESSWPNPGLGEQVVLDARVGDPPVVTFTGAVLRLDGPLLLEIPLV